MILRNDELVNEEKVQLLKENTSSKQIVIHRPCTPIDSSRSSNLFNPPRLLLFLCASYTGRVFDGSQWKRQTNLVVSLSLLFELTLN